MYLNNKIIFRLLSLFFIPIFLGGVLVLSDIDKKTSVFIIIPIISIILVSFLSSLFKMAKQNFFQYDEIFKKLGFQKRNIFLILTTYEKTLGNSTLRIMYSPGRASYQSIFHITAKVVGKNDLIIGHKISMNMRHVKEMPNVFSLSKEEIKVFTNNINWAQNIFSQEYVTTAVREMFPKQSQHDTLSIVNGQLLVRVLFHRVHELEIKNFSTGNTKSSII